MRVKSVRESVALANRLGALSGEAFADDVAILAVSVDRQDG